MRWLICILSHRNSYRLKIRGKYSDHMICDKCGREISKDRYSTGPK